MVEVAVFSKGKTKHNEDYCGYSKNCFVVADGATDKSGKTYDGKTGGYLISHLVVKSCLKSKLNGVKLVNKLNKETTKLYKKLGVSDYLKDPKIRFNCVFVLVRIVDKKVVITYLGDLGFRLNNSIAYREVMKIDTLTAEERSEYITKTGDIEGSRVHILPMLIKQINNYQNNPKHKLGYGVIDGTKTPTKFVKVFEFNKKDVKTIELFTDGYLATPQKSTIDAWEKMCDNVEKEDPYKYKKYKSTKVNDDRTIMIVHFK